jgi:hypothetical protein
MDPWWQQPRILGALALACIVAALIGWILLRWLRRERPTAPSVAIRHDWESEFLRRLEELRVTAATLTAYQFAIACSNLLREYIEVSRQLPARYQTTREFLEEATRSAAITTEDVATLGSFLRDCDQLKFARIEAPSTHLLDFADAFIRRGVNRTATKKEATS